MTLRASFSAGISIPILITWLGVGGAIAQDQPVKRTELLRTDVSGVEGREGVVYTAEVIPGGVAPKHTHPGDEVVYVLEGVLIIEPEGKEAITLKPGELTHLPAGLVHSAKNGSDQEPAKALVFLVAEKGKPLATPVQ
jgi:quercetin dioxygenase-like cupin family protein